MLHPPKEEGTTALFKNPILEKLARTHISVPLTIYFIGSAIMLYINFSNGYTGTLEGISLFLFGAISWTWVEYIMHKHVFHMLPNLKVKKRIQYLFHGVHHEFPRDKTRLAMPPAAAVMILTALFLIFRVTIGTYVFTFLPGFIVGYSLYLLMHFSIHSFKPPKNMLGTLWINHSIHHYKDDTIAFGVSTTLWDVVYGTMPKKTYKKRKKTVKKQTAQAA
ncbi:MAG: sterol desaturase/sphingolipid hydroxylase (fatty acid hydroxylase superfamily) [Cryomorphaceae bacterium]|jgi:sterol desaturase/sphingolipid hydroxylase (fatty acid hydroxylase superfamily)